MTLSRFFAGFAAGAFAGSLLAAPSQYPLTLDNCGMPLTFAKAPERVVSIGQAGTELLYALGLGERLVGTALWFNRVQAQYAEQNARVERLADNEPSFEAVLGKRPALVTAQFEWMVGPQGAVATREQFHELSIPSYILPTDCEGKDNLIGADGTRLQAFRIDSLYRSIEQLAQIFDVPARGAALLASYRQRLDKAVQRARRDDGEALRVAFWFSSADLDSDPYMAGRNGVADFMLSSLGMRNIIESNEEWPAVGWETIARANPDILVIARMDRRRFPADDHEKKLHFLQSDPLTRNMDAVKHGRILIMDAEAMQASTRLFDGLEQLAEASTQFAR